MFRLATAVLLLAASPALAAETRLRLDYDVRYGPLRLLELRATVDLDGERYRGETEMRTVGIAAVIFPWESRAESSGVRIPGGLQPEQHRSRGTYRGQKRSVDIDYGASGAVSAHIEPPPEEDWRTAVPPEQRTGTIDPLSAGLSITGRECSGSVPVFDGRRRYNLKLVDMGEDVVEASSYHVFSGKSHRCRAIVEALSGFWQTDPRQSETPTTLDFWLASPRADAPPLPVYLELSGVRGTLRIHLTAIAPADAKAAPVDSTM